MCIRDSPALPRKRGRVVVSGRRRGYFLLDILQRDVDAQLLVRRQHSRPDQRLRPGATPGDVLAKEPAVDVERSRELVDEGIRLFAESPSPWLFAQWATFEFRLARISHGKPPICAAGPHHCWLKLRLCNPRISGKNSE